MGDNALCASGVPFGVRYKSQEEIDRNLNKPVPPAPGGTGKIPSFAENAKFNAKGKEGLVSPNTQLELFSCYCVVLLQESRLGPSFAARSRWTWPWAHW